MSDERTHHVTVRLAREYEFVAEFDDVPNSSSILLDEPEPLGHNRAPNAAALLGAAVGDCLAASLAFCLRKSRTLVDGLTANVATHITRNEQGRFRISGIDVELAADVAEADKTRLDRCQLLFEDFCIVTQSVRQGIPVNVAVKLREPVEMES
jgi:uncharacterized OsmC-like protein